MNGATARQAVIAELHKSYLENGFITEDEALSCFAINNIPLSEIDSITEHILGMGVLIHLDEYDDDEEGFSDRSKLDYDEVFDEVITLDPSLITLITYVREITPPQRREWQKLIPQMSSGNAYAFNRLFDMYLRIAVKIALRISKDGSIELDDAIQVGAMGLIRAIRQYDPSSHGNIGSYLPLWIQQYIDRAVANTGRMIRLPVHMIETLRKIETSSEKLTELYARRPTLDELAQETELPLNILNQLINGIQITVSLDYLFETDENFDIADSDASMVDNIVGDNLLKLQIDEILKTLTPKEKKVIQLRFGLSDDSEWTLEEIGQMFGVTRERIRQIEAKAMRNLNHPTRLNKLRDFLYNE